jgi:cytochrome c oxidase assembly protein subunit 11
MSDQPRHALSAANLLRGDNVRMFAKLLVVTVLMFGFGYAMVPLYKSICTALGINVLTLSDKISSAQGSTTTANSQVDSSRTITVEFDANSRGIWKFKPAVSSVQVHPGELTTVMYEFTNTQNRTMAAQAIPSYAPMQAMAHFHKLQCFCFNEYTMKPGETRRWPVVFVIEPKLPKDVTTITLSYTFFEVGGKVPAEPQAALSDVRAGRS